MSTYLPLLRSLTRINDLYIFYSNFGMKCHNHNLFTQCTVEHISAACSNANYSFEIQINKEEWTRDIRTPTYPPS